MFNFAAVSVGEASLRRQAAAVGEGRPTRARRGMIMMRGEEGDGDHRRVHHVHYGATVLVSEWVSIFIFLQKYRSPNSERCKRSSEFGGNPGAGQPTSAR